MVIALQRTGDPGQLSSLRPQLELLAGLDPSSDAPPPGWQWCGGAMEAVRAVVTGLVHFIQHHGGSPPGGSHSGGPGAHHHRSKLPTGGDLHTPHSTKYKTSMCRDLGGNGGCPRGTGCTFAHSEDELDKYRGRTKKNPKGTPPTTQGIPQHSPGVQYSSKLPPQPPTPPVEMVNSSKAVKNGIPPPVPAIVPQVPPPSQGYPHQDLVVPPPHTPAPPYVPVVPPPPHSQSLVMAAPPPPPPPPGVAPALVRPAPPMAATPVYAPAEYAAAAAYGAAFFPPALHPTHAHPPHQGAVFPAGLIPQDLYNGSPHPHPPILVNQTPVYNLIPPGHPGEFLAVATPTAESKPATSIARVSAWPDYHSRSENHPVSAPKSTSNTLSDFVNSRSLAELKERKMQIMTQLEVIVGKEATHHLAEDIANGHLEPQHNPLPNARMEVQSKSGKSAEFTSTYSIWTSGANFYTIAKAQKDWDPTKGYRTDGVHEQCAAEYAHVHAHKVS